MATSISGVREAVTCLKTILHFRNRPLILHFLVDDRSYLILNTLFDTWQLPMGKITKSKKLHEVMLAQFLNPELKPSLAKFLKEQYFRQ